MANEGTRFSLLRAFFDEHVHRALGLGPEVGVSEHEVGRGVGGEHDEGLLGVERRPHLALRAEHLCLGLLVFAGRRGERLFERVERFVGVGLLKRVDGDGGVNEAGDERVHGGGRLAHWPLKVVGCGAGARNGWRVPRQRVARRSSWQPAEKSSSDRGTTLTSRHDQDANAI